MPIRNKNSNSHPGSLSFAEYHKTLYERVMKPHQRDWLDSILAGDTMILGARQIGKSWLVAYAAVLLALGTRGENVRIPAQDVLVISADQKRAMNIIKEVNTHLRKIKQYVGDVSHKTQGGLQTAVLHNNRKIQSVSGRSLSLQGFTGHVIIDELAITQSDPDELFAQALAVTSSKEFLRIVVCTNADRRGSFVDDLFNNENDEWLTRREGFKISKINIHDAHPKLTARLMKVQKAVSSPKWKQYYLNEFISGQAGFFDPATIQLKDQELEGSTWISVDPGFSATGNPTGIVIARVSPSQCHVIASERWWAVPELEQVERLKKLYKEYGANRMILDAGAGGNLMCQKLVREVNLTKYNVNRNKTNAYFLKAKSLIEDGVITFGSGARSLREDLLDIEIGKSGDYLAPQIPDASGGKRHADCAFALTYIIPDIGNRQSTRPMEILGSGRGIYDHVGESGKWANKPFSGL